MVDEVVIFNRGLTEGFFRVKCGNETCYGKTRLPYEFKLIAIISNMVLEPPSLCAFDDFGNDLMLRQGFCRE